MTEGYGAQSTPAGWQGWICYHREVTWLTGAYETDFDAIEAARVFYDNVTADGVPHGW